MSYNKLIAFWVIYAFVCQVKAFEVSSISLSKSQMFEDFDFFVSTLDKVSPRLEVVKKVTNANVLNDLAKLRNCIDTVTSAQGFCDIMLRSMIACKDQHIGFSDKYPYKDKSSADLHNIEGKMTNLLDAYCKYDQTIDPFQVFYVKGKYFVPDIFDRDSILQIPARSQLLEINGLSIDDYIDKWIIPTCENVRWDHKNKRYFVSTLFSPQRVGQSNQFVITFLYQGNKISKKINNYRINIPLNKGVFDPNVLYFEEDKILYIRVPSMESEWIESYKQEILRYKKKEFNKIVVDIRRNRGGSDEVWENILSCIIDKSVFSKQTLAFKDNLLVNEYLIKNNIVYNKSELLENPLFIGKDTLFCIQSLREIKPIENSLNYNGTIYVLVDQYCFSSSLAFSSFSQNIDRLVTVGTNSGYFGGEGVAPFYFILPNSKYIFTLECSLDATSVAPKYYDKYYHDNLEILVDLNLNYILKENLYDGLFYSQDYLYNIDPVFRTVLKIK